MDKLVSMYGEKEFLKEHEEKWGSYNSPPPGWKEVDEEQFVRFFFHENIKYIEHRQIHMEGEKSILTAKLFFTYSQPHLAMVEDYDGKKFRYFLFGCDHDWKFEENLGRCYNRYRCSKCQMKWDIDSSD